MSASADATSARAGPLARAAKQTHPSQSDLLKGLNNYLDYFGFPIINIVYSIIYPKPYSNY